MNKHYDIIIVGGGMVGMTIACALAQQSSLSICLLEANTELPSWRADTYHPRVSAFAMSSIHIFKSIGVWECIRNKRVSPFTGVYVWDDAGKGEVGFNSADIAEPQLGCIIENVAVQTALVEKIQTLPQVDLIKGANLSEVMQLEGSISLVLASGDTVSAKLAVAADGAASWLREQAKIAVSCKPYHQQGVVTEVETAMAHGRIARQVFLPSGPLAFLPLTSSHASSIVWSLPDELAAETMAMDDQAFMQALAKAFSHKLGEIISVKKRFVFPLKKQQASRYVSNRIVLAGDAAHTMHPLAGQGVNVGLLDAASLVEVVVNAHAKQRDIAGKHVLRRYERWRKADNAWMLKGVDAIKHLFASEKYTVQALRSYGLNMTNDIAFVRNIFTAHAVGQRSGLPKMATHMSS